MDISLLMHQVRGHCNSWIATTFLEGLYCLRLKFITVVENWPVPGQHSLTVLSFTIDQNTISCTGDSSDTVATTFCSEHTSTDVVVCSNQNLHGDLVAWV